MITIFISHTQDEPACSESIPQSLEAKGYTTRRESTSLTMESILYPCIIEIVIPGQRHYHPYLEQHGRSIRMGRAAYSFCAIIRKVNCPSHK